MDKTERLNLGEDCVLAAWDLMAIAGILRGVDDESEQPGLLYDSLAIRSRRTARALMEIGATLAKAKEGTSDSRTS